MLNFKCFIEKTDFLEGWFLIYIRNCYDETDRIQATKIDVIVFNGNIELSLSKKIQFFGDTRILNEWSGVYFLIALINQPFLCKFVPISKIIYLCT